MTIQLFLESNRPHIPTQYQTLHPSRVSVMTYLCSVPASRKKTLFLYEFKPEHNNLSGFQNLPSYFNRCCTLIHSIHGKN